MADPIKQFEIKPLNSLGEIGGYEIIVTNAAAYMMLTVGLAAGFMLLGMRPKAMVPGRWQASVEWVHDFIAKTLRDSTGEAGMRFFPLVLTLFLFILTANLIGMFPYAFTVTAHIIITLALALIVFATVTLYGVARNGFGFLRIFMPPGVPIALSPFIVPIEIISYFARPLSHSLRLFAAMLAGHITLKVFAQFAVDLADLGMIGLLGAILPLVMTVLITALELLMAVLQAYIFTLLTCMYLKDAVGSAH